MSQAVELFHDYCAKAKGHEPDEVDIKIEPADVTLKPRPEVAAGSRIDGWLEDDISYFRPDTELPTTDRLEDEPPSIIHPDITISVCFTGIKLHGMK